MKKSDLISIAWQNLKNRKTRTILTICGVVIGTCAIIIMLSIGLGIDKMITDQYKNSANLTKISVYSYSDGNSTEELKFDDSTVSYFSSIDGVKSVVPVLDVMSNASISTGKYNFQGAIFGIDLSKLQEIGYKLSDGSYSYTSNSAFFGNQSVTNFCDNQGNSVKYSYDENYNISDCEINAMKDSFRIAPKAYTDDGDKIGNYQKLDASGVISGSIGQDYDATYSIYIDLDFAKKLIQESNSLAAGPKTKFRYYQIGVYVEDAKNIAEVKKTIQDAGYSCSTDDEALESSKKVMKVVQLILGAIGAVSMFVAAFGISNTMVMSVFERQKEIGILKVIGCDIKDIRSMFLYEAAIIGGIGGIAGVVISYIMSFLANGIGRLLMNNGTGMYLFAIGTDVKIYLSYIPPWLAICGVLFSALIGILAGLSPANKSVKVSALTAIQN